MSATGYAAHRSTFASDDWWRLEAAAFRGEHEVRDALAMAAPRHLALTLRAERAGGSARDRILMVPKLAYFIGALTLTAVWGLPLIVVAGRALGGESVDISFFGVVAAVSAVLGGLALLQDVRSGDPASVSPVPAFVRAVPAVIGVIGAIVWLIATPQPEGGWSILPMVLDLAVSIATIARARRSAPERSGPSAREASRLQVAVDELSESRRAEIRDDLTEAIGVLEAAGAIDARAARRARSAPLGALARTMTTDVEPVS